jgi:hypothetical protein
LLAASGCTRLNRKLIRPFNIIKPGW